MENDERLNNAPSINSIAEPLSANKNLQDKSTPTLRARKFIEAEFPDKVFSGDADYDNGMADYMEQAKQQLLESEQANKVIAEVLFDNPELADLIEDLKNGVPFRVALAKQFGPDDLTVGDDEQDAEQFKKAVDERRRRRESAQERIRIREANMEVSQKQFDEFLESTGWSPERQEEFVKWMQETLDDFGNGKITKEVLTKLRKAFEFDQAVEEARQEGEIDGRNATIEGKRQRKSGAGDGLPTGGTGIVLPDRQASENKDLIDEVLENSRRRAW